MNRLAFLSFPLLVILLVEVQSAARPREGRAVTEPSWVTDLLGPTMFPPSTTRRPTLPDRIQAVIQQVTETFRQFPDRIGDVLTGVRQAAANILRRPTTAKPQAKPAVPAAPAAPTAAAPATTLPPTVAPAVNATVL